MLFSFGIREPTNELPLVCLCLPADSTYILMTLGKVLVTFSNVHKFLAFVEHR